MCFTNVSFRISNTVFCSYFILAFAATACATPTPGTAVLKPVALRGFGALTITPRFYPATKSSWVTFKAQDEAHAADLRFQVRC